MPGIPGRAGACTAHRCPGGDSHYDAPPTRLLVCKYVQSATQWEPTRYGTRFHRGPAAVACRPACAGATGSGGRRALSAEHTVVPRAGAPRAGTARPGTAMMSGSRAPGAAATTGGRPSVDTGAVAGAATVGESPVARGLPPLLCHFRRFSLIYPAASCHRAAPRGGPAGGSTPRGRRALGACAREMGARVRTPSPGPHAPSAQRRRAPQLEGRHAGALQRERPPRPQQPGGAPSGGATGAVGGVAKRGFSGR